MSRKQLMLLFLCTLLPYIVGSAIMSLIPLYSRRLGANASETGFSLAISFMVLALSSLGSGWLAGRFQRRKAFIVGAAALSVPVTLLVGEAQNIIGLTLLLSALWCIFGIITTMVNIITGLYASEKQRGRAFGLIGASLALARVLAGLTAGPVVDRWGFPALFIATAGIYVALVLVALFLEDKKVLPRRSARKTMKQGTLGHPTLLLLMGASILAFSVMYLDTMTRPLAMAARRLNPTAITMILAISGLATLPLPYIMGWLSDRVGRRLTLMLCYLMPMVGIALMISASTIWQFGIAEVFLIVINSGIPVGSALIADLVEPEQLSVSLALYSATKWMGAVLAFTGTGITIQYLGLTAAFYVAGVLALLAVLFVRLSLPKHSPLATQAFRKVKPSV
jgi:MFS family permease